MQKIIEKTKQKNRDVHKTLKISFKEFFSHTYNKKT